MQLVGDRIYKAVVHRGGPKRFHDVQATDEAQHHQREHRWLRNLQNKLQPPEMTTHPKMEKTAASSDFSLMTATCTAARVLSMGSADCTLPALSASAVLAFTLICSLWLSLRFLRRSWSRSFRTPPSSPAGEKVIFEPVELAQRSTVEAVPRGAQLATEMAAHAADAGDVNEAVEMASEEATDAVVARAVEEVAENAAGEALKNGLSPAVASITEDVSEGVSEAVCDGAVNSESAERHDDAGDAEDAIALLASSLAASAVRAVVEGAVRDADTARVLEVQPDPAALVVDETQGSPVSSIEPESHGEVKDACNVVKVDATGSDMPTQDLAAALDSTLPAIACIDSAAANAESEDGASEEKTPEQNLPVQRASEKTSTNEVHSENIVNSHVCAEAEKLALPKEEKVALNAVVAPPLNESAGGCEFDDFCDASSECAFGAGSGPQDDHADARKTSRAFVTLPKRRTTTTTTLAIASVAAIALVFVRARHS